MREDAVVPNGLPCGVMAIMIAALWWCGISVICEVFGGACGKGIWLR